MTRRGDVRTGAKGWIAWPWPTDEVSRDILFQCTVVAFGPDAKMDVAVRLDAESHEGDTVLVRGSRRMRLEELAPAIRPLLAADAAGGDPT
jgi:hypothetical protein